MRRVTEKVGTQVAIFASLSNNTRIDERNDSGNQYFNFENPTSGYLLVSDPVTTRPGLARFSTYYARSPIQY